VITEVLQQLLTNNKLLNVLSQDIALLQRREIQ